MSSWVRAGTRREWDIVIEPLTPRTRAECQGVIEQVPCCGISETESFDASVIEA